MQILHDATCATLQAQLDAPQSGASDEYRITSPECVNAAYTIPAGRNVSIRGAPTRFTGAAGAGPVLSIPGTGTGTLTGLALSGLTVVGPPDETAVDVRVDGSFSLYDSTFIGAAGQPGPGVSVLADSIYITDSLFRGNSATYGGGLWAQTTGRGGTGARSLLLESSRFEGNAAGTNGGGAYLLGSGGTIALRDNAFTTNTAGGSSGGGAVIDARNAAVTLERNRFTANDLGYRGTDLFGPRVGGGLALLGATANGVVQVDNRFDRNVVRAATDRDVRGLNAGGGEYLNARSAFSSGDVFAGNRLLPPGAGGTSEGAGLAFGTGVPGPFPPCPRSLMAVNLIAVGNAIAGSGRGPGVAVSCERGAAVLELHNSTLVGNTVGAGSPAGLAGRSADSLTLRNSIAFSGSAPDLAGFIRLDARNSDACQRAGAPYPGQGNLCANPRLANPATGNVGQTSTSPTWDAGGTSLVPLAVSKDAFGAPRIQGTAVDIGAHERPGRSDQVRPRLSRVRLGSRRFRVPPGTRLRFRVSEPGRARVVMRRRGRSRKYVRVLSSRVRAGRRSLRIGRVGGRALRPGRYSLTLTVTDRAGNRSRASRLSFQVRRRR